METRLAQWPSPILYDRRDRPDIRPDVARPTVAAGAGACYESAATGVAVADSTPLASVTVTAPAPAFNLVLARSTSPVWADDDYMSGLATALDPTRVGVTIGPALTALDQSSSDDTCTGHSKP